MREGFSLIELLILAIILSILTAVAISNYLKYKNKAIVSRIQSDLISCAGELMAEYADRGIKEKTCITNLSNDTCTLIVSERGDYIKIANSNCTFKIKSSNLKVICTIKTDYGDVNGVISCSPQ